MNNEQPNIKIPEEGTTLTSTEVKKRLDKIDAILIGVVVAVIIALISITVAVFGIFLDQMRYNNAAYKDYSQKVQSVSDAQTINQVLLEQNEILLEQNKSNQEIIIEMLK